MAKTKFVRSKIPIYILLLGFVLSGCSLTKSRYQREYTRLWKEIIKSEAWRNSLLTNTTDSQVRSTEFVASNEDTEIAEDGIETKLNMATLFDRRFHSMVSRAYFKIISEAEDADVRLSAEYERWSQMQANGELKKDRDSRKHYDMVTKRYHAHKQMLEGLKSWNIFSEYRSNDLDFFMAENRTDIQKMYENGSTEDNMINFLVYRLADLYHYKK